MTVDELRQAIKALPLLPEQAERFTWLFRRKDLRRMILEANPEEFLTWPIIKECCFVGNAPYISSVAKDVDHIHSVKDSLFGKPEYYDGHTSGNFILHNYHSQQLGMNIGNLSSIIEFGAGYGAMALICSKMGFTGKYDIVDLPEFSLLQEYYLSNTIGTNHIRWWYGAGNYDLLIAICSLSEVDIETRNSFFGRVKAKSYLIVFQPRWQGIDNMKYFTQLRDDNPQLNWRMYPNPHYQNHWYLVGK